MKPAENLVRLEDARESLRPLGIGELLAMNIPEREMMLSPVIQAGGLVMLYAPRGIGKTHLALGMAYAVATGTTFLRWQAPQPRKVLYLDGEMPLVALRDRLKGIVAGVPDALPLPDNFVLLAADHHRDGLPNIGDEGDQDRLLPHFAGVELVVFDNISTLASGIRENEADDWAPIQRFILRLRRRGIGVLLIHHAGRNGQARGTSKREDILDAVIALKRPADYDPSQGARFEIHFEKARGFCGLDAEPFEASLDLTDGLATWGVGEIASHGKPEALEMFAAGEKVPAVVTALGAPRATVYRWHKEWKTGNGGDSR